MYNTAATNAEYSNELEGTSTYESSDSRWMEEVARDEGLVDMIK